MNAHSHAFTLDYGVTECPTCEGKGSIWNGHGRGGNDPDSWHIECRDCDGNGHFACEVCGNNTPVPGYDCWCCEMAADLPDTPDHPTILDLTGSLKRVLLNRAVERDLADVRECAA